MKHAAKSLDPGPMRVAVNDDVNPLEGWIQLQCLDVVQDITLSSPGFGGQSVVGRIDVTLDFRSE
jgi:hypothetical protein